MKEKPSAFEMTDEFLVISLCKSNRNAFLMLFWIVLNELESFDLPIPLIRTLQPRNYNISAVCAVDLTVFWK